jgi:hypothetical protein
MRSRLVERFPPGGIEGIGELVGGFTNAPIVRYSTENDDPQPQVEVAFGFLMVNPPPVIVSTKSTSAPFR